MKGYIVIENWDNCEMYEDKEYKTKVLALCTTKEIAKRIITNRKSELISLVENYNKRDNECVKLEGFETGRDEKGLYIDHNVDKIIPGTYCYSCTFDWEIKEFPFIGY